MRHSIVRSLLAGGALTLAVLGHPGDSAAEQPCNAPVNAVTCLETHYRDTCGHANDCKPLLQSGFQGSYSADPVVAQYRDLDDEKSLLGGSRKRRHTITGPKLLSPGGLTSYAGLEGRAHALAQSSSVAPSAGYTRNATWLSNGIAFNSCAEYVYEKYYDYMRFVDASNSCKGDDLCILDMAYTTIPIFGSTTPIAPAIANRVLHGRGVPAIDLTPFPLTAGQVAKNGFYNGALLLTPALVSQLTAAFPGSSAGLGQLAARLYGGANYYRWGMPASGGPAAVASYATEWDYHAAMRTKTASVPLVQGAADRRRTEAFDEVFAGFFEQAYCHGPNAVNGCLELPDLAPRNHLLERIGGDPFIRAASLGKDALRRQAWGFGLADMAFVMAPNGGSFLSQLSVLEHGMPPVTLPAPGSYVMQPGDPNPSVDPSVLWQVGTVGGDLQVMWTVQPPVLDTTSATPQLDCEADQAALDQPDPYRNAACQATNALLTEWSRTNPGCLDAGYYGCDWQPKMFTERFAKTQLFSAERARSYNECMRWTQNSFGNILVPGLVPASARANVQDFEEFLQSRRDELEAFEVPQEQVSGRVVSFGEGNSDSVQLGDADTFGGGYSYNASWHSNPYRSSTNGPICRLDFAADASFKAWVSAPGVNSTLVDAQAHVLANQNNQGGATFLRRVKVLDNEFILNSSAPVNINGPVSTSLISQGDDTNLFQANVQLGYGLQVDVSVDAEYHIGAVLVAHAVVPQSGCMGPQGISALALLEPFATASVVGSVYGGWLGIVEAGVEAELDLIKAELPIKTQVEVEPGADPTLRFDLSGELTLSTLSGHVDVCGCFLVFCGCQEIVSWPGQDLGTAEVFTPVHAQAALTGM